MRRLTVEISSVAGSPLDFGSRLGGIDSIEGLYFLSQGPEAFAVIFRVNGGDPRFRLDMLLRAGPAQAQLIEERGDSRTYLVQGIPRDRHGGLFPKSSDGFLSTPFEFRGGVLVLTFLGTARGAQRFLKGLSRDGFQFRIRSLVDARLSLDSPLGRLTEKQRRALLTAFDLGYYDSPRRISTSRLARRLGTSSSTFVVHRRKAEYRLLQAVTATWSPDRPKRQDR
jgi:hypothetical protein